MTHTIWLMHEVKLFIWPKNIHFPKIRSGPTIHARKVFISISEKMIDRKFEEKIESRDFRKFRRRDSESDRFQYLFSDSEFRNDFQTISYFRNFWKKKSKKWFISSFCSHLKNKIQIWQSTKDNFSKITISSCSIKKNHRNSWDLNSENFWKFLPKFLIFF